MNDLLPAFIFFGSGLLLLFAAVLAVAGVGLKLYDFVVWLLR